MLGGNAVAFSGAFSSSSSWAAKLVAGSSPNQKGNSLSFYASKSNSIYTGNGHVYPLSLALNFIIKA